MPANADIVRGIYGAIAAGDAPTVLAGLDAGVEWIEAETFPTAGTYTGPDAVLNGVLIPLANDFDGFKVTPAEFVADGDKVVSIGRYSGAWKATGKAFETDYVHVWTLRDGKVTGFHQYVDSGPIQDAVRG